MTEFICVSGKAQNGKDTSARIMKEYFEKKGYKVLVTHYADLLKYICKQFFEWNGEKDEKGRSLLQMVGTDVVRKEKPNFWVDFVISIAKLFPDEWNYIIVPDTRFPNEIIRIKEKGFTATHVGITRVNFVSPLTKEQQNHPSETALDNVIPDYFITNDTLEKLKEDIEKVCEKIINRKPQIYQLTFSDLLEEL